MIHIENGLFYNSEIEDTEDYDYSGDEE